MHPLTIRETLFDWSRTYLVGVLNTTPDSFSDGGLYIDADAAVDRAAALVAAGADVVDIGGESTRPGASQVDSDTEIVRTVPVIRRLRERGLNVPISVDTSKAAVADAALAAGADIVNDISGGLFDPGVIEVVARASAFFICGHVRGTDIGAVHASEAAPPSAEEVAFELCARVAQLPSAVRARTIVDPCLGFGKGLPENVELIRWSGQIARAAHRPVMIGPSRKRFIRALSDADAGDWQRADAGTVAACLAAVSCGSHFVRVHNMELLHPAIMVYEAITGAGA